MSYFINTYGGNLEARTSGLGAIQRAQAAGLTIGQIQSLARQEGITFGQRAQDYLGYQTQISGLQNTFQQQMQQLQQQQQQQLSQQASQFASAQRRQEQEMQKMQQQALEAQTRQASPQQAAQVLGVGKALTIRPGARTRFSRPELQIKSVNI